MSTCCVEQTGLNCHSWYDAYACLIHDLISSYINAKNSGKPNKVITSFKYIYIYIYRFSHGNNTRFSSIQKEGDIIQFKYYY